MRQCVAVFVLILAVASAGSAASPMPRSDLAATTARLGGRSTGTVDAASIGPIVFASVRAEEGCELYTLDLQGHVNPLTAGSPDLDYVPCGAVTPAWSPDGRRVATYSYARLQAVAAEPKLVPVPLLSPSWAPDGRRLVGEVPDTTDIGMFDLRTKMRGTLYEPHDSPGFEPDPDASNPDWSPRGDLIAMTLTYWSDTYRSEAWKFSSAIGLMKVNGPFTRSPLDLPSLRKARLRGAHGPAWSPDGRRIAFAAYGRAQPATAAPSIYVTAVESKSTPRLIIRNGHSPAWSADGKKIVFVRDLTQQESEIFVVNSDGTGSRRLTYNAGRASAPDWKPSPRTRP